MGPLLVEIRSLRVGIGGTWLGDASCSLDNNLTTVINGRFSARSRPPSTYYCLDRGSPYGKHLRAIIARMGGSMIQMKHGISCRLIKITPETSGSAHLLEIIDLLSFLIIAFWPKISAFGPTMSVLYSKTCFFS